MGHTSVTKCNGRCGVYGSAQISITKVAIVNICFYPVRWPAHSTLHFTPWHTCSFRHQLDICGKHSSHAEITRKDYSLTFPAPPIARYSFIQLGGVVERTKMCNLRNGSKGDSNTGSLDFESGILPLNYRAPQRYLRAVSNFQKKTIECPVRNKPSVCDSNSALTSVCVPGFTNRSSSLSLYSSSM